MEGRGGLDGMEMWRSMAKITHSFMFICIHIYTYADHYIFMHITIMIIFTFLMFLNTIVMIVH